MNDNQKTISHILYLEEEYSKQSIFLEDEVYSIGRYSDSSIRLNSQEVSRHHATLIKKKFTDYQSFYLLIDGDLQGKRSQNGILVNGKPTIRHQLKHGDVIFFGGKNIRAIYQIQELHKANINSQEQLSQNDSEVFFDLPITNLNFSRQQLQNTLISSEQNIKETLKKSDLTRLSSFPELCPNPIIEIDWQGNITYLNPAAKLNFDDLSILKLKHSLLSGLIPNRQNLQGKLLTREIKINEKIFEQYIHYLSENDLIRSYIFDITKRKQSEEMLRYHSLHDSLTGLPNRDFFYQELNTLLDLADKNNEKIALLFVDLDRFKNINDTLNHHVGDKLLQSFTYRVLSCLSTDIFVSRWGGDEFTLIIKNFHTREEVEKIAISIKNSLKEPFSLLNYTLHITASIGISIYPQDAKNSDILINNADAALYRAKEQGRNNYKFYLSPVNQEKTFLLQLENSLYQALENNQFFLCYQPQINIATGKIHGLETLIRWEHPELGLISPSKFIPLAEETGLIIPIGEWVLETACRQNKAWQNAGLPSLRVAINLSPLQFQQDNFTEMVIKVLEKTKLDPQFLELEITESILMQDVESANKIINELLDIGVTFSLDDFGTGYSSLGYLKKFPFHTIKIDQSFIQDLSNNQKDLAIISAVVTIAKGFNMIVIAEGVETEEQLNFLKNLDCKIIQGMLFSGPLKTEDIPLFIQNNNVSQILTSIL